MENAWFSMERFNFGDVHDHEFDHMDMERGNKGKHIVDSYGVNDWGESGAADLTYSDCGFNMFKDQQPEQPQDSYSDFQPFGYGSLNFDFESPSCFEEVFKRGKNIPDANQNVIESGVEKRSPLGLKSLQLLKEQQRKLKRLNEERRIVLESRNTDTTTLENKAARSQKLSTEEIIRVAGERFIRSSSWSVDDVVSMLSNPFDLTLSGLSEEEIRDVELAEFLFAAAEKVGEQQYERATRLLQQCNYSSSMDGNPVQRLVYYFSEALREKIDLETGRNHSTSGFAKTVSIDVDLEMKTPNPTSLACHKEIPYSSILQFASIQAIFETVADEKRIHVIDLEIRCGVQWSILMQALASRYQPPEILKITAVGSTAKHFIEDTGRRLTSFAQTLNLPFSFRIVMVSDLMNLKEDLFETDSDETIAVYALLYLRTLISAPHRMENMMRVIVNLNPSVMVVSEVEANHNSPVFVDRLIEALFFYGAFFDCLEACMRRDDEHRKRMELTFFVAIRSIVAAEGEKRKFRHVKLDVWRAFFGRYGMEEKELSMSSLSQAYLLRDKFGSGSSCTTEMNGKSLAVGWKGTPIFSVSAWRFTDSV